MIQIISLIIIFQFINSDIPVHCTSDKIAGKWKFYLYDGFFTPKINDYRTTCNHGIPGKVFEDVGFKKNIPENVFEELILDLKIDFNVYQNNKKVGTWTSVYDQSFLIYYDNSEITANLKYYYKDENNKNDYISDCDDSMIGWYLKKGNNFSSEGQKLSCFVAEKIENDGIKKNNNFLQIKHKNKNLKNKESKSNFNNKIIGIDPKDLIKDIKYGDLQNIVEEINRADLTWKAKINPKFLNESLYEIFKKHYRLISGKKWEKKTEKEKIKKDFFKPSKKNKQISLNKISSFIQLSEKLYIKEEHQKIINFLNSPLKEKKQKQKNQQKNINSEKIQNSKREKDSKFVTDPNEIIKYINTPINEIDEETLPKNWDWRNVGGINFYSEERKQGDCGSCYVIGTISVLESRLRIKTLNKDKTKFSIQFPISCNFYSEGCDGGYPILVAKFFKDFEIIPDECFLYKEKNDNCNKICDYSKYKKKYIVNDYGYIGGFYGASNELNMIKELRARGPIIGNIKVPVSFSLYSSGIFSDIDYENNEDDFNRTSMIDNNIFYEKVEHTITILGYGEENGIKFWICRNSYGDDWGEKGYFRVLRGQNSIGIESMGEYLNIDIVDRNRM